MSGGATQNTMKLSVFAALTLLSAAAPMTYAQAPASKAAPMAAMDTTDHSAGWVGKTAQPFTLPSADGKTVDLSKVIGTRPVVLIFYRGVWCPFCSSQMADLAKHRAELVGSGAAVYAISNEDAPDLQKMQHKAGLDFATFLSDKDGAAAKFYAGLYPNSTVHQPGAFVIDKSGHIVYAYVNQDYKTRAATTSLVQAVRKSK